MGYQTANDWLKKNGMEEIQKKDNRTAVQKAEAQTGSYQTAEQWVKSSGANIQKAAADKIPSGFSSGSANLSNVSRWANSLRNTNRNPYLKSVSSRNTTQTAPSTYEDYYKKYFEEEMGGKSTTSSQKKETNTKETKTQGKQEKQTAKPWDVNPAAANPVNKQVTSFNLASRDTQAAADNPRAWASPIKAAITDEEQKAAKAEASAKKKADQKANVSVFVDGYNRTLNGIANGWHDGAYEELDALITSLGNMKDYAATYGLDIDAITRNIEQMRKEYGVLEWMNMANTTADHLNSVDRSGWMQDVYGGYGGEMASTLEGWENVRDTAAAMGYDDSVYRSMTEYRDFWDKQQEYYNKYGSAEEYNAALMQSLTPQEVREVMDKGGAGILSEDQIARMKLSDSRYLITLGTSGIDDVIHTTESELQTFETEMDYLRSLQSAYQRGGQASRAEREKIEQEIKDLEGKISESKMYLGIQRASRRQAERNEAVSGYDQYKGIDGFAEIAAAGRGRQNPSAYNVYLSDYDEEGSLKAPESYVNEDGEIAYRSARTDIPNELEFFLANQDNNTPNETLTYGRRHNWQEATEADRDMYAYLLETQGKNAADQYMKDIQLVLDESAKSKAEKQTRIDYYGYDPEDILEGQQAPEGTSDWQKAWMNVQTFGAQAIGAIPAALADAGNMLNGEYRPNDPAHRLMDFSNNVRSMTANDIVEKIGEEHPMWGKILSNGYLAVMSGVDSAIGARLFANGYTTIMGAGAASSKANELWQNGASDTQIALGAIASGVCEAFFEEVSLEKFTKNFVETKAKSFGDFLLKSATQGMTEASEEAATEIGNLITDAISAAVTGGISENDAKYIQLRNSGMSEEDAKKQLMLEHAVDIFWAAYGGFISGGSMAFVGGGPGFVKNQIETVKRGNSILNNPDAAIQLTQTAKDLDLGKEGEQLSKITEHAASWKGSTLMSNITGAAKTVGQIAEKVSGKAAQRYIADTHQAVQDAAEMFIEDYNRDNASEMEAPVADVQNAAELIADVYTTAMEGKQLTDKQKTALEALPDGMLDAFLSDETSADIVRDATEESRTTMKSAMTTGVNFKENAPKSLDDFTKNYGSQAKAVEAVYHAANDPELGGFAIGFDTAYQIGKNGGTIDSALNALETSKLSDAQIRNAYQIGSEAEGARAARNESRYSVNEDGDTNFYDKTTGDVINPTGIASTENGKLELQLDNGDTIAAADVSFPVMTNTLYQRIGWMGATVEEANQLLKYAQSSELNDQKFAEAISAAYNDGRFGMSATAINFGPLNKLSKEVRDYAYQIGRRVARDGRTASKASYRNNNVVYRANGVKYETDIRNMNLTNRQKATINAARILAKAGFDITVFASTEAQRKSGEANGTYNSKTKAIRFDLNSSRNVREGGKVTVLEDLSGFTLSHEVTHAMKDMGGDAYEAYARAVFAAAGMNENQVFNAVANEILRMRATGEITQNMPSIEAYEHARDEIIARFSEPILMDTDALEQFSRDLWAEDKKGWQKFADTLKKWVAKMKEAYKGIKTGSRYGDQMREMISQHEELVDKFVNALEAAAKTNAELNGDTAIAAEISPDAEGAVLDADGNEVAYSDGNGSAVFSLRTYEESGRKELDNFLNKAVKDKRLTKAEADSMRSELESIYQICKDFGDEYAPFSTWSNAEVIRNTKGKPIFSVVTPNGEYKMNLDFSLVCRKRRTLDAVLNEMSRRGIIDKFELGQKSIVKINELIRSYGFETACGLCFVDAKRFRQAAAADAFVSLYNELVESMVPENEIGSIAYHNFAGMLNAEDREGIHNRKNKDLDFSHLKDVIKNYGKGTVEAKTAKYLMDHPEGRKLLYRGDFMSSKGFDAVKINNPDILKLYNSKKGTGGPKAAFGDVQYLNEVIRSGAWTPEKAFAVGGVRVQSFSDYIPRMVFDYCQMITDLAAKQLPAHAYTKEALFVKQFGLTGIKINMSLIPAVADNGIAAGLDANGNYVWAGESFDFDTAKEILGDAEYSKNCGSIAVGVSYEHIVKLLGDSNISMVIPYHKSGLNPIVAHMNKIDQFQDYTGTQNTRKPKANGELTKVDPKDDFNFNAAVQRLGDPKAAANEYLAWCKEKGYTAKFDEFSWHDNYYKLLEDFSMYDNAGSFCPQQAVQAKFPQNMGELIKSGLQEDAIIEGKRTMDIGKIVDDIERTLPHTEDEISEEAVQQATGDVEANIQGHGMDYATESDNGDAVRHSERVDDAMTHTLADGSTVNTLEYLNNLSDSEVYHTYKSMSFWGYDENGNAILRSPMAERSLSGEMTGAYLLPNDGSKIWYSATENAVPEGMQYPDGMLVKYRKPGNKSDSYISANKRPDLVADDWSNVYFLLERRNVETNEKETVYARYNPYEHSSDVMLNDQFKGAYKRPNLVTVEMVVPKSEDNGAYRAQYSKDPTGWVEWKSGDVATKIGQQKDFERSVFLSRFAAPVRIVPDSEVAQAYKQYLEGTSVEVPDNVVSPSLLEELRKVGVPIKESGKIRQSVRDENVRQSPRYDNSIKTTLELSGHEKFVFETKREAALRAVKAKFDIIPAKWYVKANGCFYVFDNVSENEYNLRYKIHESQNQEAISLYTEEFKNGIVESTETLNSWAEDHRLQRGYSDWDYADDGYSQPQKRVNGLDGRPRYIDRTGSVQQSSRDQKPAILGYSLNDIIDAIRWQKKLVNELDDKRLEAYSYSEIQDSQRAYEMAEEDLDTLKNYNDILSVKKFQNAMNRYMSGNRKYDRFSSRDVETTRAIKDAMHNFRASLEAENKARNAVLDRERNDLIARYKAEMEQLQKAYSTDTRIMETKFLRLMRGYEKQGVKLADIQSRLKAEAAKHRADNQSWEKEFNRLLNEYERSGRNIGELEAKLEHQKQMAKAKVESRRMTEERNKVKSAAAELNRMLLHPNKNSYVPTALQKPVADLLDAINMESTDYGKLEAKYQEELRYYYSHNMMDKYSEVLRKYNNLKNRQNKFTAAVAALHEQYSAFESSGVTENRLSYNEALDGLMAEFQKSIGATPLHALTMEQLTALKNIIRGVTAQVRDANKVKSIGEYAKAVEIINQWSREIDDAFLPGKNYQKWMQRYLMQQMRPDTFFKYTSGMAKNSAGEKIAGMFQHGTERMLGVQREFSQMMDEILKTKGAAKAIAAYQKTDNNNLVSWGLKDGKGREVKTTRGMMLQAYMLLKQQDSFESLLYGGFKLPDAKVYYKGNHQAAYGSMELSELYSANEQVTLQKMVDEIEDLEKEQRAGTITQEKTERLNELKSSRDAIIGGRMQEVTNMMVSIQEQLNDTDIALIKLADAWYKRSGDLMSETYEGMFGFPMKRVKDYVPIHRDTSTLFSVNTTSMQNTKNLANEGSTIERVKSTKPILLTDFFAEMTGQVAKVSRYYGFAQVQQDFNKVYKTPVPNSGVTANSMINAKFGSGDTKQTKVGFGVTGEQFIDNLIADVAGGRNQGRDIFAALYGNAAASTLSANVRVALSQWGSIPTAAAEVGVKNMIKGAARGFAGAFSKKQRQELAAKNVYFWNRYRGMEAYDEISEITGGNGIWGKFQKTKLGKSILNWCQGMDVLATGKMMWCMAEEAVLDTGVKRTDANFEQLVNEKYTQIIRHTQPNYTTTERSDLLRDKRPGMKLLTMYKTQAQQNLNILMEANLEFNKMARDLKNGKNGVTAEDKRKAAVKLANSVTALVLGNAVFSLFRVLGNALVFNWKPYKDEEEGKFTTQKLFGSIWKDFFSSFINMLNGGSYVYDAVYSIVTGEKYYGISDSAIGLLGNAVENFVKYSQGMLKDGDRSNEDKFIASALKVIGIPADNFVKIKDGLTGWKSVIFDGGDIFGDDAASKAQHRNRFFSAYESGDNEKMAEALQALRDLSSKVSEKAVNSEVAEGIRTDVKKKYLSGEWSKEETIKFLNELYDMDFTGDAPEDYITRWDFAEAHPEASSLYESGTFSVKRIKAFEDLQTEMNLREFYDIIKGYQACTGVDENGDGNADNGTKKAEQIAYVQGLKVSDKAKQIIWVTLNGKVKGTPWE